MVEQIVAIAKRVFEMLTDPDRPKDNVTEWAKMQACWDQIKAADIRLSASAKATLRDLRAATMAEKAAKETQKLDNGIATQVAVLNILGTQWGRMRAWADEQKLLTPKESELLRLASQMPFKLPTEKQCNSIWQLRSRLLEEGYAN